VAKIVLNIEAEDANDLKATLMELADAVQETRVVHVHKGEPGEISLEPGAVNYTDGPERTVAAGAAETAKRTRRTKAQIEADNAAASKHTPLARDPFSSPAEPERPNPFAEQVREVTQDEPSTITIAQLRAALSEWLKGDGRSAQGAQDLLTKVAGVPNLGAATADQYPAILAALAA
jgi:hypothetical protein